MEVDFAFPQAVLFSPSLFTEPTTSESPFGCGCMTLPTGAGRGAEWLEAEAGRVEDFRVVVEGGGAAEGVEDGGRDHPGPVVVGG